MNVNRIIGEVEGKFTGGTTVFIAGLHGNEPAGVKALKTLMAELSKEREIFGKVICLAGNIAALKENQRYLDEDLNRIWTKDHLQSLTAGDRTTAERCEMADLFTILTNILETAPRPLYFIDLHTVSVE
ncbi:MAG: succinylglutamate desuccinylase/aspartoacylase family protein, partial [Flavobacteriaceae bacterium]|nr:succinylglutamate desuccinylase/aspartoacylase family protein [Flavobacteriaceae bacterium]